MNKIALVEVFYGSECRNCESFSQTVAGSITEWVEVSDADLKALTTHVQHLYTDRSTFVVIREADVNEVSIAIEDALERVRKLEAQAEVNRQANKARAAKAAATKEKREKEKKIKQFEALQKSLREEGLLKEDGSIKSGKQIKKK